MQVISCEPLEDDDELGLEENSVSDFSGVWVRVLGASGDETDLAIGVIPGESNRVYMCEKLGSTAAGFYKGNIYGNKIVWDATHGLPKTTLRLVGSQLEFHYTSVDGSLPTFYNSGNWSSECGPLSSTNNGGTGSGENTGGENSTSGKAAFWVQSDLGCGNITVILNGVNKTISQFYTQSPGCSGSGSANYDLPGGTYSYTATCSGYSWDGSITVTNGQCSTIQLTL